MSTQAPIEAHPNLVADEVGIEVKIYGPSLSPKSDGVGVTLPQGRAGELFEQIKALVVAAREEPGARPPWQKYA